VRELTQEEEWRRLERATAPDTVAEIPHEPDSRKVNRHVGNAGDGKDTGGEGIPLRPHFCAQVAPYSSNSSIPP